MKIYIKNSRGEDQQQFDSIKDFVYGESGKIIPTDEPVVIHVQAEECSEDDWDFGDEHCEGLADALTSWNQKTAADLSLKITHSDLMSCNHLVGIYGLISLEVGTTGKKSGFEGIFTDLTKENTLMSLCLDFSYNAMVYRNPQVFFNALNSEHFKVQYMKVPVCTYSYELGVDDVKLINSFAANITLTECDIVWSTVFFASSANEKYNKEQVFKENVNKGMKFCINRNKKIQQLFSKLDKVEESNVAEQNKIKAKLFEFLYRHPKVEGNGRELLLTKMFGNGAGAKKVAEKLARQMDALDSLQVTVGTTQKDLGVENVPVKLTVIEDLDKSSILFADALVTKAEDLASQAYFRLKSFESIGDKKFQDLLLSGRFALVPFFYSGDVDGTKEIIMKLDRNETIGFSKKLLKLSHLDSQESLDPAASSKIDLCTQKLVYAVAAYGFFPEDITGAESKEFESNLIETLIAAVIDKGFKKQDGSTYQMDQLASSKNFHIDDLSAWIEDVKHVLGKAVKEELAGTREDYNKPRQLFADKLRLVLQDVLTYRDHLLGENTVSVELFNVLGRAAFPETPAGQAESPNVAPSWDAIKGGATYETKFAGSEKEGAPGWTSGVGSFGLDLDPADDQTPLVPP